MFSDISSRIRTEARNEDIKAPRAYAISIIFIGHVGTLVPEWGDWTGYFGHARVQFYLFIPLVFFVRRPRSLIIVFLICALAQGWIQRPWGGQLWFIRSDAPVVRLRNCAFDALRD